MSARLIVVGGFLGAGKTSAILRLADMFIADGKKVGIVTNDQSENLVDTHFLRGEGKTVLEVTRGCFCCNFDGFTLKLRSMSQTEFPDVILAEPVGSCTDLVATIFKPMMNSYTRDFKLAPLSVLADPRRIKKFITAAKTGFINEINYLFDKQLSEADIILINKCDLLDGSELDEITTFLRKNYPGAEVMPVSALTGEGYDAWLDKLTQGNAADKPSCEIDYDIYARAEAALGWYNSFTTVTTPVKTDINAFVASMLERIRLECSANGYEIAHIKAYAVTGLDSVKASITATDGTVSFAKKSEFNAEKFNLILNARVEASPGELECICEHSMKSTAADMNAELCDYRAECFAPSYPTPKHRMK